MSWILSNDNNFNTTVENTTASLTSFSATVKPKLRSNSENSGTKRQSCRLESSSDNATKSERKSSSDK